jgi:hypothetical protein
MCPSLDTSELTWTNAEEFGKVNVTDLCAAIAADYESAAKSNICIVCNKGKARSASYGMCVIVILCTMRDVHSAVKQDPVGEAGLTRTCTWRTYARACLHSHAYTYTHTRAVALSRLLVFRRACMVNSSQQPLGFPYVDHLRHEFHCALKYVRGLSTGQPEYPTLADQYGRFLDVVRCLYAGVPYKIGSRFCKARLGERDRSPAKQQDFGPAPRQTLDQAKAAGGLCLLQLHLQCMVKSGGFAVHRLGTRLFNALYPNLGGLVAGDLPQDKYIAAGQPDVGRRTTPLPSWVSQDLQNLVHHFVLSGEG